MDPAEGTAPASPPPVYHFAAVKTKSLQQP